MPLDLVGVETHPKSGPLTLELPRPVLKLHALSEAWPWRTMVWWGKKGMRYGGARDHFVQLRSKRCLSPD